jgi:hypothetical protein
VDKLGTNNFGAKIMHQRMVEITVIKVVAIFVCIVASQAMTKRIVSN